MGSPLIIPGAGGVGDLNVAGPTTEQVLQAMGEQLFWVRIWSELLFRTSNGQTRDEALRVMGITIQNFPKAGEQRPKADDPKLQKNAELDAAMQAAKDRIAAAIREGKTMDEAIAEAQAEPETLPEAKPGEVDDLAEVAAREDGDLALD